MVLSRHRKITLSMLIAVGVLWIACFTSSADAADPAGGQPLPEAVTAYSEEYGVSREVASERLLDQSKGADLVEALRKDLKDNFSSVEYLNDRGRFRITVTDTSDGVTSRVAANLKKREVTAEPEIRLGKLNYAALERGVRQVSRALETAILSGNVKVAVDPAQNGIAVVVVDGAPESVRTAISSARRAVGVPLKIETAAPDAVRAKPSSCSFPYCSRPLRGGVAIDGRKLCTAGFMAFSPNSRERFVITAGHCLTEGGDWSSVRNGGGPERIGPTAGSVVNGYGDAGAIRVNGDWNGTLNPMIVTWNLQRGVINSGHGVQNRGRSYAGLFICRFGRSTSIHCGTVQRTGVTINYGPPYNTPVGGQTEVNTCAVGGDSGGPVMAGNTAYGTTSASNAVGNNDTCNSSPLLYYQEILDSEQLLLKMRTITSETGPI